jgi:hypothetical protein
LENVSSTAVAIEVYTSPLQYLDLIATDRIGQVVSTSFYGDLFSPLDKPYTLRLRPGEKYTGPVGLLATVPVEKQHPGKYTVQAVYEFEELWAVSESLRVVLTAREDS